MEFNIKASDEEKQKVVDAVRKLNAMIHVTYMSYSMFEEECQMSQSKIRITLQDLMDDDCLVQIATNGEKKVKRYYYVVTEKGNETYPLKEMA
jgi:DNA-binding HxlR family transcriptional regulator